MHPDRLIQCSAAFIELALLLMDTGEEPSARFLVAEALAFCGERAPSTLLDLFAVLTLSERFGDQDHLDLLGSRVTMAVDSPPHLIRTPASPLRLLN